MNKSKKFGIVLMCLLITMAFSTVASAAAGDEAAWGILGFAGIMCIIPIILLIIGIVLAIWVYKDAEKRGSSGVLWLIVVLLTGIIGLIIWLVVRPPIGGAAKQAAAPARTCPNCGRPIPMDARVCPYCSKKFEG